MANFNFLIKISQQSASGFYVAFGVGYLHMDVALHICKVDLGGLNNSKSFSWFLFLLSNEYLAS